MKLFEMEGFLRGKCLPGDMLVNETNAQYLVRKMTGLEEQVKQLAAENSALKDFISTQCFVYDAKGHEGDAEEARPSTPATDAILASLRAEGVEMFAYYISIYNSDSERHAHSFASQLRSKSEVQS